MVPRRGDQWYVAAGTSVVDDRHRRPPDHAMVVAGTIPDPWM
jgi:hypothetical protein